MADDYRTRVQYTSLGPAGLVESVTIRETTAPEYPSGWDYSLHLGTVSGIDLLRYDNAHERTKGHELHTPAGDYEIEFPGMGVLLVRFRTEVEVYKRAAAGEWG